jgi:hypothetical protein
LCQAAEFEGAEKQRTEIISNLCSQFIVAAMWHPKKDNNWRDDRVDPFKLFDLEWKMQDGFRPFTRPLVSVMTH